MIPVEKENVKMETIKMAKDVIDSGHLLLVFPEGHVNPLDEIAEYKSGAVMIAMITKSPILPVYIKKREKWWQVQKVMIGEKINIEDFVKSKIPTMEDVIEVTKILKQEEELLAKLIEKGDKQC